MIFRAITEDGDWTFGAGLNNYLTTEKAIEANILTRLKLWVGDCFWSLLSGIDWATLLDIGQQDALVDSLKSNILNAYGVVGVNSVNLVFNGQTRAATITFDIQTIYSSSFQGTLIQTGAIAA